MARKALIRSDQFPYHVTNRSNNKEWFYIPMPSAWEIFCSVLRDATFDYETEVHAFLLMSNHYHMVLSTPEANLDAFMRYFQTEVSRRVQQQAERINHVFGARYKWSLLPNPFAVMCGYKYTMRNPVRAGLVSGVETYQFSSWRSVEELPIVERIDPLFRFIPWHIPDRLAWLNMPTPKEVEERVAKALRRFEFAFSRGNDARREIERVRTCYGGEHVPDTFSAEK